MKTRRHIVIPGLLLIYFACMSVVFGRDLLSSGQYVRFFTIAGVEILLIIATFFALRRKNALQQQRENDRK